MIASRPGFGSARGRDRVRAMAAVALVHLLLGYALLAGLKVRFARPIEVVTALVDISIVPPPPPIVPIKPRPKPKLHKAATPAHVDKLGGSTGPAKLKIPVPVAPLVLAATTPSPGGAAGHGTAIGTGSGGGTGGNGYGDGDGEGGTDLEQIAGEIRQSDYPHEPLKAGIGGRVEFTFTVGVDGRVHGCAITRSSGNADLDLTTCRLVTQRFRYRPPTDTSGHLIAEQVDGEQVWRTDPRRADEE